MNTSSPSVDGPWGAVYPAPRRALYPLTIGPGFLPVPLPAADADWTALKALAVQHDWQLPLHWRRLVRRPKLALVLTDATQQICWVNAGFTEMSGYAAAEALGRRPGFLQGTHTAEATRAAIRECLQRARPFAGTVLNYRRDGQPYLCYICIRPVRNAAGTLTHFLAFEHELPSTSSASRLA